MASPGPELNKLVQDTEYIKTMTTLVQHINKAHSEWGKKNNEFNLVLTKSKANINTRGSHLEGLLQKLVSEVQTEDDKLRKVEVKFVLNQLITHDEQIACKTIMATIVKKIKDGQKIKALLEG